MAVMGVDEVASPAAEWDRFAEAQPGATLGHAAAWAGILRGAYGLVPRYLASRDADGALDGVLPLFEFRTLRGARELVSIPFHDAAAPLAREPAVAGALEQRARELLRERGARALELRRAPPGEPTLSEEPAPGLRVNLVLPLEAEEEAQWKGVGAKVRNQVRKAEKSGLEVAGWDAASLLDGFYDCFAVNMRDLGSPVHAKAFFRAAAEAFGERMRIVVAADGRRAVGGLIAIHYAGRVTVTWASTLRSERRRCPNNLIYWEAIRWAVSLGAREFDFGRSPVGGGTHRFKRGWGARERPLLWERVDASGAALPPAAPREGGVLERLSRVWERLPVGLTTALGPRVRRFLSN